MAAAQLDAEDSTPVPRCHAAEDSTPVARCHAAETAPVARCQTGSIGSGLSLQAAAPRHNNYRAEQRYHSSSEL